MLGEEIRIIKENEKMENSCERQKNYHIWDNWKEFEEKMKGAMPYDSDTE